MTELTDNEVIAAEYCVYHILNIVTLDCYVGSTVSFKRRISRHLDELKRGKHHSIILQRAFDKYGNDAFKVVKLESGFQVTKSHILSREQFYIDTIKPKYNIWPTAGSGLGSKRTEETKKKFSEIQKGRIPWNKGIKTGKLSPDHVAKIRKATIGHSLSEEGKLKVSKSRKGKKLSVEHRLKLSKVKTKHGKYLHQKTRQIHYVEPVNY